MMKLALEGFQEAAHGLSGSNGFSQVYSAKQNKKIRFHPFDPCHPCSKLTKNVFLKPKYLVFCS